ncbi:MAG: hypothetical protein IH986_02290 [Planctomycetes bacterium]|nr:hypothetical protein [Planctomycetota bacterium]
MNSPLHIRHVQVFPLAIPMRFQFEHAAAARDTSDSIVVQLAAGAPYAHYVGYGETLARPYVTGESPSSVIEDAARIFAPLLAHFHPTTFADALEFIEALPTEDDGRVITAARAAIELALIDLVGKVFRRRPADITGWMGLAGFGEPGCLADASYSGIVAGNSPAKLRGLLRLQRCYGLRDFKIKVGNQGWERRLAWTHDRLKSLLERQLVTLRADANGAWSLVEANEAIELLERCGVCALEQPLPDSHDCDLPYLAEQTRCDLIADESLLTLGDAQRLIELGAVKVFNIRIAKNGGLMPALRIARLALSNDIDVQLGCLVGETSILSAAGVGFLSACPKVRFVEGAYGRFLLRKDVTNRPLRFGRGGRIARPSGDGLGVVVNETALRALCVNPPRSFPI